MDKIKYIIGVLGVGGVMTYMLISQPADVPLQAPNSKTEVREVYQVDYDCTKDASFDLKKASGKTFYACVFSQEHPDTHIFPDDLHDATFVCSHLDNVYIPPNNRVITEIEGIGCGSRLRYEAQNDGEDWLVDEKKAPIEPIDKELFEKLDISTDPDDIPEEKQAVPITIQKEI